MRILHLMVAVVLLCGAAAGCGGDSDDASSTTAASNASALDSDSRSDDGDEADNDGEGGNDGGGGPADGNASITLGTDVYRFTTTACSTDDMADTNVAGVITLNGEPAYVEFLISANGEGIITIDEGVTADVEDGETMEESLERGLTAVWNLFYTEDQLEDHTDTVIAGTGTFQKVMSLNGTSGEELNGAFEADCS